ncbi:MAG: hypothetical protein HQ485_06075 [Acidobacteria bacterium]|nr:hypothetical protein [Acidobacteriota bacterium]
MSLPNEHPDRPLLLSISDALMDAGGGTTRLEQLVGEILRECVDKVIQAPKTGRRFYEELQNTEKTYIGTSVEIDLRSELGLSKGTTQDLEVAGHDVDVKFTGRKNWMIPPEALGHVCVLISADEKNATFNMGLLVVRSEYLTAGANRDAKRSISAAGRTNILWLFKAAAYPKNFWLTVQPDVARLIAAGRSGNERMLTLFREIRDRPIARKVIADVAGQLDFTRRVRADGKGGTRNQLAAEGILVLSGSQLRDRELVEQLGFKAPTRTEYFSHRLLPDQRALARLFGFDV